MRRVRDDCGRELGVPRRPQRIICLCPSLTETLFSLGLANQLVGRTRYCVHPQPEISEIPSVGGTKQLDLVAIEALRPDLIIAEKEENRREDVETLASRWPVYVCDIQTIGGALRAIERLGSLCARESQARELSARIARDWASLPRLESAPRVLYLIWRKPWMAAGRDTYIQSTLERLGCTNLALELDGRYPQLEPDRLSALPVELCLLSSEPYPFAQVHRAELQAVWPSAQIQLVDGEMFSWYGSRMLPAADYLRAFVAGLAPTSGR